MNLIDFFRFLLPYLSIHQKRKRKTPASCSTLDNGRKNGRSGNTKISKRNIIDFTGNFTAATLTNFQSKYLMLFLRLLLKIKRKVTSK